LGYLGQTVLPFDPIRSAAPISDADRFSGNASTVTFTLSRNVTFPTDIEVFVANVQQEPATAYTVSGNSLTFSTAPPSGTNNVYVVYRNYQTGAQITLPDGSVTHSKIANNIRLFTADIFTANGTGKTFVLSEIPADANTIFVTVEGVVQQAPSKYTVSGNTLIFTTAVPSSNVVSVRHLGFRTTTPTTTLQNAVISGTANITNIITSNLRFSGTGNRITGDFSNATLNNRVSIQTSTINGDTSVGIIPNGSGTTSRINIFNSTDLSNYSIASLQASSADVRLTSGALGTGTQLPMTFYVNGTERMRISNTGNVGIGTGANAASRLHISDAGSIADNCFNVSTPANDNVLIGANLVVDAAGNYTKPATALSGAGILFEGINNLNDHGAIKFLSASDTNTGSATPLERMIIDASGRVGIGIGAGAGIVAPLQVSVGEPGGEILRLAWNTGVTTQGFGSIGFSTTQDATQPNALIRGEEIDTSDYRGNLLFATRATNIESDAPTTRLKIDYTGVVSLNSNAGLSISETTATTAALASAYIGNVSSGTYTPAQVSTNVNVSSITFGACQYMRVGNTVTVGGQILFTAVASGTDTTVRMSLPIASNFASTRQLGGSGAAVNGGIYGTNGIVCLADVTNKCVEIRGRPTTTSSTTYNFSFTYQVN